MASLRKDGVRKVIDRMENIKMVLRCGICCSTLRDAVMTTCNHSFCRVCLDECFKRLPSLRCPVCNLVLNKRSCASCPSLTLALEKYLLLAKAFKKDLLSADFKKGIDFVESQIPTTQIAVSPLLSVLKNQQQQENSLAQRQTNVRKGIKRSFNRLPQKLKILQRTDEANHFNVAVGSVSDASVEMVKTKGASCNTPLSSTTRDAVVNDITNSKDLLFKQIQTDSEEAACCWKKMEDVSVQVEEAEIQHEFEQKSEGAEALCSSMHAEILSCIDLTICGEKNQKNGNADRMDPFAYAETFVNAAFARNENKSRIEVLVDCMPWISDFLRLSREDLISAVKASENMEEVIDEHSPSKNDADLVLESDEETQMTALGSNFCGLDPCIINAKQKEECSASHLKIISPAEEKSNGKNDKKLQFLMVSGMSKLSHRALIRGFLDYFPSFKLSTTMHQRCTHLVVFNADGLVCEFWSVKFIYALVSHCTIVSYSWLEECLKQKSVVPTDSFEVSLKINEAPVKITAQRALIDPSTLFHGFTFYVPQNFFGTRLVERDVFLEIIKLSGGSLVSHVWELPFERSYIIFGPNCLSRDAALRFEMDVKKEVLTADWIFASIGQHRILNRQPYRLISSY